MVNLYDYIEELVTGSFRNIQLCSADIYEIYNSNLDDTEVRLTMMVGL